MAQLLSWGAAADKVYFNGIDQGVLFLLNAGVYDTGFAWEGLISIAESPGGAEPTDLYANNSKYTTMLSAETFNGTIEAYTYPDEFMACDGIVEGQAGAAVSMQARAPFGLCYRTLIHSDGGGEIGYELHLVYGCVISPSEKSRATINESPEAVTLSWEFASTPVPAIGYKNTSKLTISSLTFTPLAALEVILYGDDSGPVQPRLPDPDEIIAMV